MSAVIKSGSGSMLDNIFIFYDFKQVRDAVLVVTYFEQLRRWEKLFVYYTNNHWECENLLLYMSKKKFNWVCEKLNLIFKQRVNEAECVNLNIDEAIQSVPDFMVALNETQLS